MNSGWFVVPVTDICGFPRLVTRLEWEYDLRDLMICIELVLGLHVMVLVDEYWASGVDNMELVT